MSTKSPGLNDRRRLIDSAKLSSSLKINWIQKMLSSRIIHLATHGSFDPNIPLDGWLALTLSGSDNGLLTAAEIFGLNLNAELVVLPACTTGPGKITGDGVIGLSRSFISAGVPRWGRRSEIGFLTPDCTDWH